MHGPWIVSKKLYPQTSLFVSIYDVAITPDQFPAAAPDCLFVSIKGCRGFTHLFCLMLFATVTGNFFNSNIYATQDLNPNCEIEINM